MLSQGVLTILPLFSFSESYLLKLVAKQKAH